METIGGTIVQPSLPSETFSSSFIGGASFTFVQPPFFMVDIERLRHLLSQFEGASSSSFVSSFAQSDNHSTNHMSLNTSTLWILDSEASDHDWYLRFPLMSYFLGEMRVGLLVDPFPLSQEKVTEECLERGISVCKDGAAFKKIGKKISEHAERYGYGVVERFVGHGVGKVFHSEPIILHNFNDMPGRMVEGQTFTIEPILTLGSIDCIMWDDNWTTLTADGSLAAQFEHTLLITRTGAEILTKY